MFYFIVTLLKCLCQVQIWFFEIKVSACQRGNQRSNPFSSPITSLCVLVWPEPCLFINSHRVSFTLCQKCKCNQPAHCGDCMNMNMLATCLKTINRFCSHTLCQHSTWVLRQIYESEVCFPDDILSFSLHMVVLLINVIVDIRTWSVQRITLCPGN